MIELNNKLEGNAASFEVLPAVLQKSRSLATFYDVPLGRQFPTFRRIVALTTSGWSSRSLKNLLGILDTVDEGTIIAEDFSISMKTPIWKPFALVAYAIFKSDYKRVVCQDLTSYILVEV